MARKLYIGREFLALASLLLISTVAEAQFSRVFVAAKTGNDANACNSVSTPCQTFAGAILQVDAGGEVIVTESGGYGPVTINKAVTINASGVVAFIHFPSSSIGNAITINAGATDTVILRGLTLNGETRSGIAASSVGQLFIEHCNIADYVIGVFFAAPGGTLLMRDDDVRDCVGTGVVVQAPTGATARAIIRDCAFGNDGIGVAAEPGTFVTVAHSVAAGSRNAGFAAHGGAGGNADMSLDYVQAVSNFSGLEAASLNFGTAITATILIANCLITQNVAGVQVLPGGAVIGSSPGTNLIAGNGTDINGTLGTPATLY